MSGGDTIKTILRSFFLQKAVHCFAKKDQRRQTNQLANHSLEFKFQRFEVTTKFTTETCPKFKFTLANDFQIFEENYHRQYLLTSFATIRRQNYPLL